MEVKSGIEDTWVICFIGLVFSILLTLFESSNCGGAVSVFRFKTSIGSPPCVVATLGADETVSILSMPFQNEKKKLNET